MTLDLGANDVCQQALWSIIAILMIRELAQMLTSENICKHYFCELENWIDWTVILTTIFYLIQLQRDENSFHDMNDKASIISSQIFNGGKNQWTISGIYQWTINLGALAVLSGKYYLGLLAYLYWFVPLHTSY